MNTEELRKAAKCVFLAVDAELVAQDLSDKLIWAANEIDRLSEEKAQNDFNNPSEPRY